MILASTRPPGMVLWSASSLRPLTVLSIKEPRSTLFLKRSDSPFKKHEACTPKRILPSKPSSPSRWKKLLEEPPDTIFLFDDEFSLSNTATLPYTWGVKEQQPVVDRKQRQRERHTTFGGLNIAYGQITTRFADKGNCQTFKKNFKKLLWVYREAHKNVLVVENVRYLHAKLLKSLVKNNPRIEIMYPPLYSPDLNPIERVWR